MNARRLVLAVLCTMTGALVVSAAPALAATGNAYKSQFNGSLTAAESFVPYGLTVNAGGDVYVVDDKELGVVDEFGPSGTGRPLAEFKGSETHEGSFASISAAVSSSGEVYVADLEHGVVDKFNVDEKYETEFNGEKTPAGSFSPLGVAVNAAGDVYVADHENGVVDVFNADGKYESQFNGEKTAAGAFAPFSVAVSPGGDVYVAGEATNAAQEEYGVVDEFNATGTKVEGEIKGSETPQGSFFAYKVAVAPSGEVYVVDLEHHVVDRFSSSGAYLSQIEGGATPQGSFLSTGLAVGPSGKVYIGDEASGFVDVFSAPVSVPIVTTRAPLEVKDKGATLTGSIEPTGGLETSCEFRYGTTASYGSTAPCVPAGPFSGFDEVHAEIAGLSPETTYHYRLEGTTDEGTTPGEDKTFTTPAAPPPTTAIKPVTSITAHSATFNGEVNPEGNATTYHFEDSTDGVHWSSLGNASAGSGSTAVSISQNVDGLAGDSTYHVRLVAESVGGSDTSSEATFPTPAAPPQILGTGVTDITAGEATLHATIDPENQPAATYRFEYGTTAAYGTTVPVGEGHVGSAPSQVSEALTGLVPGTAYHFRVVASNGIESPTSTTDQTFTTFSNSEAAGGCPNEQLRGESAINPETGKPFSMQLPECRAYEMVSPPLKNGASFTSANSQGLTAGSIVSRVGSEGSTVLVDSTGIWPDKEEQPANNDLLSAIAQEGVRYKLTRGESGWGFKPEVPPASDLRAYIPFITPNGADMSPNGIWSGAGFAPDESNLKVSFLNNLEGNLYLLEPDGALAEVGPSVPLADHVAPVEGSERSVGPGGASADLSRVLFNVPDSRWTFDQTELPSVSHAIPSLYEYAGTGHTGEGSDVPTLVGVDNTGALISQCGTQAGGSLRFSEFGPENTAISSGGSTVFFTVLAAGAECDASSRTGEGTGPEANQLFARVGTPGAGAAVGGAVTVNVAGTTACETSDSCNVSKPVSYQGASTDGSKVFFTSEQPLAGGTDSTNNLFECRLPGDSGAALTRMAPVNPCPGLVRVSVPVSGGGAEVQSVAAVSADGSHVYFVAKGVLSGANAEHNSPAQGQDNLYVWQQPSPGYPQGGTAFIATLPAAMLGAEEGEGGQATPDGDSFVFTSSADLTPDDTSTVNQVFLYEAQHEALIRVSKGQDGFNHDGNTTSNPASIARGIQRRTISEDGSTVVFQSSEALTPQVHGGTRNVYLWRGGNVSLISDGTPAGESVRPALASVHSAGLVGIDASGQNVFFVTETHLVGQDSDELPDLYDARIDGGFPAPKVNECIGEACQGVFGAPSGSLSPGSLSPSAQGNLPSTPKSAPKPKPKVLTRSQQLAKALKACKKDKSKEKRAQCKTQARKRYGAKAKAKGKRRAKRKTRKSSGKGGK